MELLDLLADRFDATKTKVVEKAIHLYAEKFFKSKLGLLEYAGVLSEREGDELLAIIRSERVGKKQKVDS